MENFEEQLKRLNQEWCEAGYKESVIREFAFLGITHEICGIEINAFTPYYFMLLDFLNSPFINPRKDFTDGDVFQFLYVVSTVYKKSDKANYELFVSNNAGIDVNKAITEICEYISDSFLDAPPEVVGSSKSNKRPYTAWITPYIDILATEYGWTDEYIIRLPFNRFFQYIKTIDARKSAMVGNKPIMFNKYSDTAYAKISELLKKKAESEGKVLATNEEE